MGNGKSSRLKIRLSRVPNDQAERRAIVPASSHMTNTLYSAHARLLAWPGFISFSLIAPAAPAEGTARIQTRA